MARSVSRNNKAPAFDVMAPPSNAAVTFRPPRLAKSRESWLHSVGIGVVSCVRKILFGRRTFADSARRCPYLCEICGLGDALTVTLHNRLSEPTNLHFHGLGVSPLGNGDNVFLHVGPGETFTYQVKIPAKHVGLLWFHPHMHGDVDRQIIGGMSGGIIVEGSERLYPFLGNLTERVILFKHHPIGQADYQELVTVNGTVAPAYPIRAGEAQFWQMGNIGADRFLRVKVEDMPFYVIGRDGYFLPRPIRPDEVLLGPGQRASAIVVGGQPGRYAFKSVLLKFDERQLPLPEIDLGTVVSEGPPADVGAAEATVSAQHVDEPLYVDVLRSSPIAHRRTFAFSVSPDKARFFINEQVFDENRTDVTVRLGDTEEWTILNQNFSVS